MTTTQTIVAIVGAAGTLVAALVAAARLRPDRARVLVDSATAIVATSDTLLERLSVHVAELQTEVDDLKSHQQSRDAEMVMLRARNRSLEDRVAVLEQLLVYHDIPLPPDPVPEQPT